MQPRHADPVALPDASHIPANCGDMPNPLMAGDEWQVRLDRPVTFHGMQIGVTDPAGLDFHQYPVGGDVRHIPLLDGQGSAKFTDDGGFHGLGHRFIPRGGHC